MSPMFNGFPGFNFQRSSTKNKGHVVVDYGIDDVLVVDVSDQELRLNSRKSFGQQQRCTHYRPRPEGCYPLNGPNCKQNAPIFEDLSDCWINPHAANPYSSENYIKTTQKQQIDKLFTDQPDILIGAISDELSKVDRNHISRHFHSLKYSFDVAMRFNAHIKRPDDYKETFKGSQKYVYKRYNKKRSWTESFKFLRDLDSLMDDIFEIPRSILLKYLKEGLIDQYDVITENAQLGNCLGFCEDFILYPHGVMDKLQIDPICITPSSINSDDYNHCYMELDSPKGQSIEMSGIIYELSCHTYDTGQSLVGVRSDYSCTLLAREEENVTLEDDQPSLFRTYDTVSLNSRALSLAVNPYYEGEAVVALENGSFCAWSAGRLTKLQSVDTSPCSCTELFWLNCFYGSTPRSLLILHCEELLLLDTRSPRCNSILKLPNNALNRMDKLSRASCLHPTNPHQLLLTSEQSLFVMDERFTSTPLIAVNHSMRSRPRFMHTLADEQDSSLHTMAFIAGYKHRDTRCIELGQSRMECDVEFLKRNMQLTSPVSCVRKPWRLSYCDSWLQSYTDDSRVLSLAVETRLKQPLIGLGVHSVRNESRDLFAVQLTKAGDLFCEVLSQRQPPVDESVEMNTRSRGEEFFSKIKEKCRNWVDVAFDSYNAEPLLNECGKINSGKAEFNEEVKLYIAESQSENSRIIEDFNLKSKCSEKTRELTRCKVCEFPTSSDEPMCNCCKLDLKATEKLSQPCLRGMTLMTNKSLEQSIDVNFPQLVKFPEKSKDPLSKVLLINWNNDDDYIPVNLDEKSPTGVVADESLTKKRKTLKFSFDADGDDKTVLDEKVESDPGWYLSESGTLEFGKKPNASDGVDAKRRASDAYDAKYIDASFAGNRTNANGATQGSSTEAGRTRLLRSASKGQPSLSNIDVNTPDQTAVLNSTKYDIKRRITFDEDSTLDSHESRKTPPTRLPLIGSTVNAIERLHGSPQTPRSVTTTRDVSDGYFRTDSESAMGLEFELKRRNETATKEAISLSNERIVELQRTPLKDGRNSQNSSHATPSPRKKKATPRVMGF